MNMRIVACFICCLIVGCGAVAPGSGGVGITGEQGPQGVPGAGDPTTLSWGKFGGSPPAITLATGGPIPVVSFTRFDVGDYQVVYDIPTHEIGIVAAVATAFGTSLDEGENAIALVGVTQDMDRFLLTIDVYAVLSLTDIVDRFRLTEFDTMFSLVIFGE